MKINGLKVVDPKARLLMHITQRDCTLGNTKDPGACAAARCLLREVPGSVKARVHLGRTYIQLKDKWLRFKTPQALRAEIIAFDRGGKFAPGEYALAPMPPSARKGVATGSSTNKTKVDRKYKFTPPRKFHTVTDVRQHGANR